VKDQKVQLYVVASEVKARQNVSCSKGAIMSKPLKKKNIEGSTAGEKATEASWFYGWLIVAIAFLAQGVSAGTITYSYSVIAVIFNEEFDVSRLQLMLPMTAMTFVGIFLSPVIGANLDKRSIKYFMLAGSLCLAIALFLLSLATSINHVISVYAFLLAPVQGLLGALCCSVLISRWFSRKLALAMGIAAIGTSIGGFIIPPLIEWLNQQYGWREGMRYLSMGVIFFVLPLTLLVFDRPELKGLFADGARSEPDLSNAPTASEFNTTKAIIRSRAFWFLAITMGFLFSSYTALISNLLPLVMLYDVSRQDGTLLISIMSGVGILGKLIFGVVADKIDLRLGLATAVILLISGISLFMFGTSYSHFVVASVVMGLSVGGMLPVWGAMIALLFGAANYGRAMGMMGPVIVLCNLVAVPLTGYVFDQTGSYSIPLTAFIILLTVSLLWISAIKRPVA
jgi:sugar phosphate permease